MARGRKPWANWSRRPDFYKELKEGEGVPKKKKKHTHFVENSTVVKTVFNTKRKTVKVDGHTFTKIKDESGKITWFSPDGMDADELQKFVEADIERKASKQPHLIDILLDGGSLNPTAGPPLSALHNAKKFIFDASASEFLGELLVKAQPEILAQHDWARPPFDTIWVEMDHSAYWEFGLKRENDSSLGPPDDMFGFFVDKGTVWTYAHSHLSSPKKDTACSPFQFKLHTPISFEEELEMAKYFDMNIITYRTALLGGLLDDAKKNVADLPWWQTVGGEVVRAHKMFVNPAFPLDRVPANKRGYALRLGAGDLKLVLATLLMITKPRRMFTITEQGPKRMLYKGHNLVRRGHSVVTMRLAKDKAMTRALKHEFTVPAHRQMHDVRGHWAQTRRGPVAGCEHSWQPVDKDHFYCLHCGAKRWWRIAHSRGELRLGDKTTDYDVTR